MKVSFQITGSFDKTRAYLRKLQTMKIDQIVKTQAQRGVDALASATPKDSARASISWRYEVEKTSKGFTIKWLNSDIENGYPVALMIQYGHGTGTGGYVQGIDYINPAMRPVFHDIAQTVWRAVIST